MTKNTNFTKLVQESHQANSSNSNKSQGGRRISFPELTWYLKGPALPKNYETCKEIGKNDSYTRGKRHLIETVPKKTQMLDINKDYKSTT